jgi:N-methylhydantoinase A/oxoprolinase/acetone carboxylase beta subunit
MKLIGVDVGGTFTDLVLADTDAGRIATWKVPTTPDDPALAVLQGVRELCRREAIEPDAINHVHHGTTIATNAVLTYDGARTGMITTMGYRDILHIGRHQRPQHYSIRQEIPWQNRPLVRRRHRKTVTERLVPPKGEVLVPLDETEVRAAAEALRAEGVEAIAVCFLFSYLDPAHEERAAAIVRAVYPECFVTTSTAVAPQFREFERFTTAAINAFVGPKVRAYVNRLERQLAAEGLSADLHIMGSNGGVATAGMVAEKPILTLLSGPAAGVLGGAWAGGLAGRSKLITFDMGGTSADIGIVEDGRIAAASARDSWIAGYPLLAPMIDVHTIGAGGGSIARVDAGGAFRVGPESVGALPGPAAYGQGGTRPTVTDANVVLGRLDPDFFLGGEMALDGAAAAAAISALGQELRLETAEAAAGVLAIVGANMANAIRSRTVQKGIDPRAFALVAFGGAGPLHAVDVAVELGIPEVVVPPHPGITSAIGLLTTDLKYDAIRTAFQISTALDLERLNRDFGAMADELAAHFGRDGIALDQVSFARYGDLRYVGQGYELPIKIPSGTLDEPAASAMFERFHRQHLAEYGHVFEASPIEIVNLRLTGVGKVPTIAATQAETGGSLTAARIKSGSCMFRLNGRLDPVETAFYTRERLPVDRPFAGPAIILQNDSTTVVPPGHRIVVDPSGSMIIRIGGET